ncbi:hypothetical protein ACWEPL_31655 [Nonomuraea sp. NPDC004186]
MGEVSPPSKGAGKGAKAAPKRSSDSDQVTNIQSGSGRVGIQAHTIVGDLHIEM